MPERALATPDFRWRETKASSEGTGSERDEERFRRTAPTLTKSGPLLTGDPFVHSYPELG
jgi:hypothetical protein